MGYNTDFAGCLHFDYEVKEGDLIILESLLDKSFTFKNKAGEEEEGWVDLELSQLKDGLGWNGAGKTYYMVESLNFVSEEMRKHNPNFKLAGELLAQGEDIYDRWRVRMVDGVATRVKEDGRERKRDVLHEVIRGLQKHKLTARIKTMLGRHFSETTKRAIAQEAKKQLSWKMANTIDAEVDYVTEESVNEETGELALKGQLYVLTHTQLSKVLQEIADE